jgi:hypothetical protein
MAATLRMEDSVFPQNLTLAQAARRLGHARSLRHPFAGGTSREVLLGELVAALTGTADAYLGYTDGAWPTYAAVRARFPSKPVLPMAVFSSGVAEGYDGEPGDITAAAMPGCVQRSLAAGMWRPVVYASVSNMGGYLAALHGAGLNQAAHFRLLSAHYGAGKHICGPATCDLISVPMDGTQWTDATVGSGGSRIDESALNPDFFGGTVSATGPASWDAADKTAFAAQMASVGVRDAGALAVLWWLTHGLSGATTGMTPGQMAQVQAFHDAAAALVPPLPTLAEFAAAVVAALPPAAVGGVTKADVEAAVGAEFAKAFPGPAPA